MRLWRLASGVMKDQNSIWISNLSGRSSLRNPDIESAVIKATSHDEFSVDYKNAERVYRWVRLSDLHVKPVVWCLSLRMEKTRSWVVALKGLMLMHGVFTCEVPVVHRIGRLPFDLSNFSDGYGKPGEIWAHNAFIRAYYTFLDQKSTMLLVNLQERKGYSVLLHHELYQCSLMQDLSLLQKLQVLLDMLIQIKPLSRAANVFLIVEAMECILMEIFDTYSRICHLISRILKRIDSASRVEAAIAVRNLKKAIVQGDELSSYFELCREIGVANAKGCSRIVEVPEEDIHELEIMINEISEKSEMDYDVSKQEKEEARRAMVVVPEPDQEEYDQKGRLNTVITDNWEEFDEDSSMIVRAENLQIASSKNINPFLCSPPPSYHQQHHQKHGSSCSDFPDLISL